MEEANFEKGKIEEGGGGERGNSRNNSIGNELIGYNMKCFFSLF